MTALGVAASLALGAVFLVAGASKLAAHDAWRASAADLGAPAIAIPVVPWLELAIGAALAVQLAVPVPAIAAFVLLLAMTALIVARLRAGDRPSCACFGAWSASPIGARHVVRNAGFVALAVLATFA